MQTEERGGRGVEEMEEAEEVEVVQKALREEREALWLSEKAGKSGIALSLPRPET